MRGGCGGGLWRWLVWMWGEASVVGRRSSVVGMFIRHIFAACGWSMIAGFADWLG